MSRLGDIRRERKGRYTLEAMARLIGVSLQTYIRKEADPSTLTVEQASKIAEHLGVSVEDVFV